MKEKGSERRRGPNIYRPEEWKSDALDQPRQQYVFLNHYAVFGLITGCLNQQLQADTAQQLGDRAA